MEGIDTYPDLFWAYTITWGILAVYIFTMGRKLSNLERRISAQAKDTE